MVESPGYPNAHAALRRAGARPVALPMDVDGWDLDAVGRIVRQAEPALAYLIPDFQNPTGNLMGDPQRERVRRAAAAHGHGRRRRRVARGAAAGGAGHAAPVRVVRHGCDHPRQRQQEPLGRSADRLGPLPRVARRAAGRRAGRTRPGLAGARAAGGGAAAGGGRDPRRPHRERLVAQRDALAAAITEQLPGWRFRLPGRRALAVVRAAGPRTPRRRRRPGRRGGGARGRGLPRPGVRPGRRPRHLRPDPLHPPRERPAPRGRPSRRGLGGGQQPARRRGVWSRPRPARVLVA